MKLSPGLDEKIKQVVNLYSDLDKNIKLFKQNNQIDCIAGCGHCCANKYIEATSLEFYPLAKFLLETKQAEKYLILLEEQEENSICLFYSYNSDSVSEGFCSIYANRGLICRLFGFSYNMDKLGHPRYITCKPIKKNYHLDQLDSSAFVLMTDYNQRLNEIDQIEGKRYLPLNTAILEAIRKVEYDDYLMSLSV